MARDGVAPLRRGDSLLETRNRSFAVLVGALLEVRQMTSDASSADDVHPYKALGEGDGLPVVELEGEG